jgi:hypothetical protein
MSQVLVAHSSSPTYVPKQIVQATPFPKKPEQNGLEIGKVLALQTQSPKFKPVPPKINK